MAPEIKIIGNNRCYECIKVASVVKAFEDIRHSPITVNILGDVDWQNYLKTLGEVVGLSKISELKSEMLVFINDQLVGGYEKALEIIIKNYPQCKPMLLYEYLGVDSFDLIDTNREDDYMYLDIIVDNKALGRLIIKLQEAVQPCIREDFKELCHLNSLKVISWKETETYKGLRVNRVIPGAWIDFKSYCVIDMAPYKMPCTNESLIPHNKRGTVYVPLESPDGRKDNFQFFITLQTLPWLYDGNYLAIGQVQQGAQVLDRIEATQVSYQSPLSVIIVSDSDTLHAENKRSVFKNPKGACEGRETQCSTMRLLQDQFARRYPRIRKLFREVVDTCARDKQRRKPVKREPDEETSPLLATEKCQAAAISKLMKAGRNEMVGTREKKIFFISRNTSICMF